ncbi:MAG: hypothetical protein Q9181_006754 [Wetmoreana brouardii]
MNSTAQFSGLRVKDITGRVDLGSRKNVKVVFLDRYTDGEAYPRPKTWVCETPAIKDLWANILATRPLEKKTRKRKSATHIPDKDQLRLIVEEDEDIVVLDSVTHEVVAVVIRNVVDDPEQDDDPGYDTVAGYTSGYLTNRDLGWGEPKIEMTETEWRQSINLQTSACAYTWRKGCDFLPQCIIDDYNNVDIPRMDFNDPDHPRSGPYQVFSDDRKINMTGEFAPSASFPGDNYARLTTAPRFCHREKNANEYVLGLITHRSVPSDDVQGGHFFIAQYGILVRSANYHGTTLQNTGPVWGKVAEGRFQQRAFTLLIQKDLLKAWRAQKMRVQPYGKPWQGEPDTPGFGLTPLTQGKPVGPWQQPESKNDGTHKGTNICESVKEAEDISISTILRLGTEGGSNTPPFGRDKKAEKRKRATHGEKWEPDDEIEEIGANEFEAATSGPKTDHTLKKQAKDGKSVSTASDIDTSSESEEGRDPKHRKVRFDSKRLCSIPPSQRVSAREQPILPASSSDVAMPTSIVHFR